MLVDTHGHVNFNAFKDDSEAVLKRTLEGGMQVIMPGSQYSTSRRAVEIAERYETGVYAAIGMHPIHIGEKRPVDVLEVQSEETEEQSWMTFSTRAEEFYYEEYKKLAGSKKVVAIGEVGLDYYRFPKSKARREELKIRQKEVLKQQFNLALEKGLPVIIHCRKAFDDLLELLPQFPQLRGVIHSYTGSNQQAETFLSMGFSFGFNGLVFKDVPDLPDPKEVIASIPLERIVLETDSPYLIPPQAGVERNEPLFVKHVAEEIARIKNVSFEEVASVTTQNAKNLFGLRV